VTLPLPEDCGGGIIAALKRERQSENLGGLEQETRTRLVSPAGTDYLQLHHAVGQGLEEEEK
jgi:hypothetical protein